MKKTLFLDQAPSSVRAPNLDTFETTTVTLQFLQHNAQYQAGVTVTLNNRTDDMLIDAMPRWSKSPQRQGETAQNRRTEDKLLRGHMKDSWFKETNKGSGNNNEVRKAKAKAKERTA